MATSSPSSPDSLLITIRFTSTIPDLTLPIAYPSKTSSLYLKHQIRTSLPLTSTIKSNRLRLIYRGKILPDTAYLSNVLKLPPPPPRDIKGKGKEKEKIEEDEAMRVYINCSIGDVLTSQELEAESNAALASPPKDPSTDKDSDHRDGSKSESNTGFDISTVGSYGNGGENNTTPSPRGFDRLLTTGFTPTEVSQLRLQFLAIQSNIHTPETMPSPTALRSMEDAWIDNASPADGGATGGGFEDMDGLPGALDDLLWGNVIGFLWPLGAVLAINEQGIWSRRRCVAVAGGAVISVMFGLMRVMS